MRFLLPLVLSVAIAPGIPACNSGDGQLRAKQIEGAHEVVGGPVSVAIAGDFLLENDQIRIAILGSRDSPAPGVFGGSIVDVDLKRPRIGDENGQGFDRFAETFPIANLLVPDPESMEVSVIDDGSSGTQAIIRVEGDGEFLFEALSILRFQEQILESIFSDVHATMRFRTDYILRPGDRHVTLRTTLFLGDTAAQGCPPLTGCAEECPAGRQQDVAGCLVCACSEVLALDNYSEPASVFGGILGDPMGADAVRRAGIVAGDFLFFGNQNDVFATGAGFDEDTAVQDAFNSGRNTFQIPLDFDFVAAAGGDVSYGYFTVGAPGGPPPVVNVPLFTSAATAFLSAGKSCLFDTTDDAGCDAHRSYTYERYIAVGEGDIASVAEEVFRVRGTPTGELRGHVLRELTGEPVANARLYVFVDPDPSRDWASVDEMVEANRVLGGDVGLINAIDADVGLDKIEDGDFHAKLPAGDYLLVAKDAGDAGVSKPIRVSVRANETTVAVPTLITPATVEYRVTDETGGLVPAKLSFVALDGEGRPLEADGRRRPYLGESRLGNGLRAMVPTASGEGSLRIEPGRYRLIVSRGIEYSLHEESDFVLAPGSLTRFDARLAREVDTDGWMSADMHLHSRPSFDSGMPLPLRVTTAAAEGVELAVSTDHDVATDYRPVIRELMLEPFITTAVGAEITTLEQGHFIGFPLKYNELEVPSHGAHDWTCEPGGTILAAIRASGEEGAPPLAIVAHPRDGFFGYVDQLGVDAYSMNRAPTMLEAENPVFRTAGCDFDAMELINGKRFDLVRTATVEEIVDWNRCVGRVNAATTPEELTNVCPEFDVGPPASCKQGERFVVCQNRRRTALAWAHLKRILTRTPEEQDANWDWSGSDEQSEELCDLTVLGEGPVPEPNRIQPCSFRIGHVDDYFRYLERGLLAGQIASSDSHSFSHEPGYPRTYFRSPTDAPSGLAILDATAALKAGHALTTYGPFVRASIGGKTFGEITGAASGQSVELLLDIETASWFGVDRVEVYLNGRIVRVLEPNNPAGAIIDVHGKVTLTVPARDSWVVVIAMGLGDENLMSDVALDIPFGELQISTIVSDAFSLIPVVNTIFAPPPTTPDWSPIPAYAVSNPIYIDTNANGVYEAPLPYPQFCSKPCDPALTDPAQCPPGQSCLEPERVCGFPISGRCDHRRLPMHDH
jgi:hypothetical protein